MRIATLVGAGAASLAISVACADSNAPPATDAVTPAPDTVDADVPDASTPEAEVPDTSLPKCSSAGWCITALPDADLDFVDIWPFEERAFAIAQSRVEGIKILEWQKSSDTWQYIDDKTQNDVGVGTYAARIYAPSEDEVYFTVAPAFIYRGKRSATPETKWTWTRQELPDNIVGHESWHDHARPPGGETTQTTLGVWGTGADDVYAYYSNTIFRRSPADGTWKSAYQADDVVGPNEHVYFTAAAAAASRNDEIWFVGTHENAPIGCPLVVRKTATGFTRIADGVPQTAVWPYTCDQKAETTRIGDDGGGWLVDVQPTSSPGFIALHTAGETNHSGTSVRLTRMRIEDGHLAYEQSIVPVKIAQGTPPKILSSILHSGGENWFTSFGLVLHGTADDTFTVSTLSRGGAPVDRPMRRIRGVSNTNLWVIGARHAYHKTTP